MTDGIEALGAQCRCLSVNVPVEQWREEVEEYQPDVIIGYPSAVKILAEMKQEGQAKFAPMRIITCGEPLAASLRSYLETVFQACVVNFYGASESLALGVETNTGEGMYLFDDLNYIEFVDGQMVLTSLYNHAQPLIRYCLTDKLVFRSDSVKSRCSFARVNAIQGREEDVLWFQDREGKTDFLHPLSVEGICVNGVLDYQFVQNAADKLEMLVELEKTADKGAIHHALCEKMVEILSEKNLEYVSILIRFVDRILPNPITGKKPLMVKSY